jgi:hypothetical protein
MPMGKKQDAYFSFGDRFRSTCPDKGDSVNGLLLNEYWNDCLLPPARSICLQAVNNLSISFVLCLLENVTWGNRASPLKYLR